MPVFINQNYTGITFADYPVSNVGVSAFNLQHDWFTQQDLSIYTGAGHTGTQLLLGVHYILVTQATDLSANCTAVRGITINAYYQIQIINVTYQTGNLFISGRYVADSLDASKVEVSPTIAISGNYTIIQDKIRSVHATTGGGTVTLTLPTGTTNDYRRVRYVKADAGIGTAVLAANISDTIGPSGASFILYSQGDYIDVEYEALTHIWWPIGNRVLPTADTYLGKPIYFTTANTSRSLVSTTPPIVANFSTAIQATGLVGIPASAKAIIATIDIEGTVDNTPCELLLGFSDNNTTTPSISTSHAKARLYASVGGTFSGTWKNDPVQVIIPLNLLGQFYTYTIALSNITGSTYNVIANGYYTGL